MSNVIAVIWDFDKTLIDGYMETPIFKEYGVDERSFWAEVQALPEKYMSESNQQLACGFVRRYGILQTEYVPKSGPRLKSTQQAEM